MRRFLLSTVVMATFLAACASSAPLEQESAQAAEATPTAVAEIPTSVVAPTAIVIPTTEPQATATPAPEPTPDAAVVAIPTTAPTATVVPTQPPATATPAPPQPTATPAPPQPTATAVPPQPTATSIPPTPTPPPPTPTSVWVNPDCYVGPGAADEPVWWCGGRICNPIAPHVGCPDTPPTSPVVQIGCTISETVVVVNEVLTFTAFQKPEGIPVDYAFDHGDGTIDRTSKSRAYYAAPGVYQVSLLWSHANGKGRIICGSVTVTNYVDPVFNAGDYLGRTPQSAEAIAHAKGFDVRITRIDAEWFPVTQDYVPTRINFEIDNGIVTRATIG